jgi:hypothetical protein
MVRSTCAVSIFMVRSTCAVSIFMVRSGSGADGSDGADGATPDVLPEEVPAVPSVL